MAPISFDNPTVQAYIFYSAVLALKLLLMSFLTGMKRIAKGVFANPEDANTHPKGKVKFDDQDIERVRRAHLNDLENIPAFWVLGALYVTTGPAAAWAQLLFRLFAGGRIIHSLVYAVVPLPQPFRAIAFVVPIVINIYMALQVIMYYVAAC